MSLILVEECKIDEVVVKEINRKWKPGFGDGRLMIQTASDGRILRFNVCSEIKFDGNWKYKDFIAATVPDTDYPGPNRCHKLKRG